MLYKGHPWEGEIWGPLEVQWYLFSNYSMNIEFETDYEKYIKFCKENGYNSHYLIMKLTSRLSEKHLDQYVVAKNGKPYPSRYPAGYVRKIVTDRDMIEWVAVREKENDFSERLVRDRLNGYAYYLIARFPRLAFFLARTIFARKEVKDRFTLLVTRNPMRGLGRPIKFSGTNYPGAFLIIPFGKKVQTIFGIPHCFGNIDRFEGFIKEFIGLIENPETIPEELLEKEYKIVPKRTPEEAEFIRNAGPWKKRWKKKDPH